MIDTLILSGGGPSGIAYAGILKALTDYDILKRDELKYICVPPTCLLLL